MCCRSHVLRMMIAQHKKGRFEPERDQHDQQLPWPMPKQTYDEALKLFYSAIGEFFDLEWYIFWVSLKHQLFFCFRQKKFSKCLFYKEKGLCLITAATFFSARFEKKLRFLISKKSTTKKFGMYIFLLSFKYFLHLFKVEVKQKGWS